jgi:Putative virion core protein (lumpy skin disease virus)
MGLIKAALGSAGGVLADQWKEYFYCDSLPVELLAVKGQKRTSDRSSNTKGSDNIITNGSVIAVATGQCMLIVEQGKVVDVCAEPGEYTYDMGTEPSIFTGDLGEGVAQIFNSIGKRFTFGGQAPTDQRIYYINTKELLGNKYGTPNPVPFRLVDKNINLDMDVSVSCFGDYSYKIVNPVLFYTNIMGNVTDEFPRSELDDTMRNDINSHLQPALAQVSTLGIRYSELPGHVDELRKILNEILSAKWRDLRGIEIVSLNLISIKASEEDEKAIKDLQLSATLRDPGLAGARLVDAQAEAMKNAAANEGAGAAVAFMGVNAAANAGGVNAQGLYQMAADQNAQATPDAPAPVAPPAPEGWTCVTCGTINKGKFCTECAAPKPAGVPQYKCDKCGWEPEDMANLPNFCPNCGDPFDDGDIIK